MRLSVVLAAVVIATAISGPATADVRVSFANVDQYSDRDFASSGSRDAALNEFRRIFARLGQQYLAPGQTLNVEVLDIDLAGQNEPWRASGQDIRVMRDSTPPRISLRYTLKQGGRTLASAQETISDSNYLMNPSGRSGGQLVYEKEMLSHWFRRKFASRQPKM